MAYKAEEIAKYIVTSCNEEGHQINNLQLQAILYCLQREYLKTRKKPLFDDDIEAWEFGAVVPSVYHRFCGVGAIQICFGIHTDISDEEKEIISRIAAQKRKLPVRDLYREVTDEGKAWHTIYGGGTGNHRVIPKELIKANG